MKYQSYQVEDFVADLDFIRWVLNPEDNDKQFWNQWIAENPEKKPLIEEARLTVMALRNSANLPAYSQQTFIQSKEKVSKAIRQRRKYHYWQWAAVITFLIISAISLYFYFIPDTYKYYQTAYAETKDIILPDGSEIILNANSELKFTKNWEKKGNREIWLYGEAFFEVQEKIYKDHPSPFTIHTGSGIDITVLGTSFNVNDREGKAEIVLNTGKVKLTNPKFSRAVFMKPGEFVSYQENSGKIKKKNVNPTEYASWTNKQLTFNDQPLADIIERIETLFGLEVDFENFNPHDKRFTGATPYKDVEILLLAIAKAYELDYDKKENKIIMKKK